MPARRAGPRPAAHAARGGDFSAGLPIWYQLAQMLRCDIAAGRLVAGDRIDPEVQFAKAHGVSVIPVRQALRALEHDGLIVRQRGRGTFVSPDLRAPVPPVATLLEALYSTEFTKPAQIFERGLVAVPNPFRKDFGDDSPLAFVRRLAFRDGRPWSFGTLYFSGAFAERITTAELRRYPLYRLLRERCGVELIRSRFDAQAIPADREIARRLDLEPFSPALSLSCVTFDADGRAVGAFDLTFPSTPFTFSFETPHAFS